MICFYWSVFERCIIAIGWLTAIDFTFIHWHAPRTTLAIFPVGVFYGLHLQCNKTDHSGVTHNPKSATKEYPTKLSSALVQYLTIQIWVNVFTVHLYYSWEMSSSSHIQIRRICMIKHKFAVLKIILWVVGLPVGVFVYVWERERERLKIIVSLTQENRLKTQ